MPRVVPITEVLAMDPKETVPGCKVRIKKVFDYHSGENSKGSWSIQNIILGDPSGHDEIKAKLKNRDELPKSREGQVVHLMCRQGDKGMSGLKVEEDTYKGQTSKILGVTPTAEFIFADEAEQSANPPPKESRYQAAEPEWAKGAGQSQPQPHPQPEPQPQPQQTEMPAQATQTQPARTAPAQPANGNGDHYKHAINDAKRFIWRKANLYELCLKAADKQRERYSANHDGNALSDQHFQAMVASLFISADRAGLADKLPNDSLDNHQ